MTRLLGSPPHRGFTPHPLPLLKDPESWVHLFEEMGKIKIKRKINTSEVNLQMMRVDSTRVRQNEVPNFTRQVELEESNLQLPSPLLPAKVQHLHQRAFGEMDHGYGYAGKDRAFCGIDRGLITYCGLGALLDP